MSDLNKKSSDAFWKGFQSAVNLYPKIDLPEKCGFRDSNSNPDAEALYNDWKKVGNDIENALRNYDNYPKTTEE